MNLYNLLHGYNKLAYPILELIRLTSSNPDLTSQCLFPRFRDAYVKENEMVVLTRTGGGNRVEYSELNNKITKHSLYIKDHDDEYDSTYALWYFRIPEEFSILIEIGKRFPDPGLRQKFSNSINKFKIDTDNDIENDQEFEKFDN